MTRKKWADEEFSFSDPSLRNVNSKSAMIGTKEEAQEIASLADNNGCFSVSLFVPFNKSKSEPENYLFYFYKPRNFLFKNRSTCPKFWKILQKKRKCIIIRWCTRV